MDKMKKVGLLGATALIGAGLAALSEEKIRDLVKDKIEEGSMTKEEGKFPVNTPKIDVEGWYQGGILERGKGRLAFFGEAGMFTAQKISKDKIKFGMNVPNAKENAQFLLNVFHWLSNIL